MRNKLTAGFLGSLTLLGLGCGQEPPPGPVLVAQNTVRQAPPRPTVRARQITATVMDTAPATGAGALAGATVDARVLIITAGGTDSDLGAIQGTLQFLGTPFDVLNAGTTTLTADMLSSGTHGKYSAVFLETGNLSTSGGSAFTTDEWNTLTTYEAQFGVRRVSLYTSPSASYGLADSGEVDPSQAPVTMTCTAAGAALFVGANCANPIVVNQGWVYPATTADATTTPLLVDASGKVYAAVHTYSDGREALALTFAQAAYFNSYLELAYGLVSWATRGVFIGERHVYAIPQLDDLFLASDIYTGGTYRITDADLKTLADWQNAKRANPQFAGFRIAWAVNGYGSQSMTGDPLTAKAVGLGSTFAWINHTWDHATLDGISYADGKLELTRNDAYLKGLPLSPYASISAVTPNISGLKDTNAMQAIHDAGIRYIVSDTSMMGENNPSPNVGIWNALQPTVFEIPRIPTDLYYNVSQPSEWIPEWESLKMVSTADYPSMIDDQSDRLAGYMLAGNKDPWMFHQANARNFDGAGHSLLSDLLEAAFSKYAAASTFPVQSPTQDQLAQIFLDRMTFNSAGVNATIQPGNSITVSVANAATVPVTGVCTTGAESYGGQTISYLKLAAGQSVTLSLAGCNTGGTGGAGGAGAGGAGGMTGSTGAAGSPGTAGTGGMSTGAAGAGGMSTGAAGAAGMSTGAAGSNGTGTAGTSGTGVAGSNGTGTAGTSGTGVAGSNGTGTAGTSGTGVAGSNGTGTAGTSGTGVAGSNGTGTAGTSGTGAAGTSGTGVAGMSGTASGGTAGTVATGAGGAGGMIVVGTGGMAGAIGTGGVAGAVSATGGAGGGPITGVTGSGGNASAGGFGGHGTAGSGGQVAGGAGGHGLGGAAAGGHAGSTGVTGTGGHAGAIGATGGHGGLGGGRPETGTGLTTAESGSGCDCATVPGRGGSGALFLTLLGAALGLGGRRRRKA